MSQIRRDGLQGATSSGLSAAGNDMLGSSGRLASAAMQNANNTDEKPKYIVDSSNAVNSQSHGIENRGSSTNAGAAGSGYTYSPSSTFQMAGNEQIQDRNQFKFHYVAMNPTTQQNNTSVSEKYGGSSALDNDVPSTTTGQTSADHKSTYYQGKVQQESTQNSSGHEKRNPTATQQSKRNSSQTQSQEKKAFQGTQPPQKMSALDRLKQVQNAFKQTWNGILTEYTGRPGTCTICNKKRTFVKPEQLTYEEERSEILERIFTMLTNIENDNVSLLVPSGHDRQSRTAQNFFNKNRAFDVNQAPIYQYIQGHQKVKGGLNENVEFKNIERSQLLMNAPPTSTYGHHHNPKGFHIDNCELLYKILKGDTKLVRSLCEVNGFNYTESHEWNLLWASSSCKAYLYEGLNEYQRLNHFPHSYEITRKDRLCFNYVKMQEKFGREAFDFMPDTYILPNEYGDLLSHYQKLKQQDPRRNVWIVKPSNSSRGRGIHIIDDINDLNVDELSIISRYVTNPLLINGYKFDLRIYVVVTCYEPLRIYVYKEGLARFASETYTAKFNKNNKYMHLTNYSVNKKNDNFVQNENSEHDDFGFKWSLSAFCKHLETVGINMSLLWSRIFDVIIKTIVCGENYVLQAQKKNQMHRQNCFEVFGFDVLLDSDLKPWLVEVNLSPSLSSDSPLDHQIKSTLLTDTFNMIQVKRFDRKKESLNKIKYRSKGNPNIPGSQGTSKSKAYKLDSSFCGQIQIPPSGANDVYMSGFQLNPQLNQIIERVSEEYADQYGGGLEDAIRKAAQLRFRDTIAETVTEYNRCGNFVRIFPCKNSKPYEKYLSGVYGTRMLNRLLHKVLFTNELLPYERGSKHHEDSNMDCERKNKTEGKKDLKYDIEGFPTEQSYDHYKTKVLQKAKSSNKQNATAATPAMAKELASSGVSPSNDYNAQKRQPPGSSGSTAAAAGRSLIAKRRASRDTDSQGGSDGPADNQGSEDGRGKRSTSMAANNLNSSHRKHSQQPSSVTQTPLNETNGSKRAGLTGQPSMKQKRIAEASPQTQLRSTPGHQNNTTQQNNQTIKKQNTETPSQVSRGQSSNNAGGAGSSTAPSTTTSQVQPQQKIMITGDDILIEYVTRLMKMFSQGRVQEEQLTQEQQLKIEKFITHYVWYAQDKNGKGKQQMMAGGLKIRLENRLNEMIERRRRLLKMLFKNEGRLQLFHEQYPDIVKRKKDVIEKFDSKELEQLLSNSTKNVAQEVVGCLIPAKGKGILNELTTMVGGGERAKDR